MWTMLPLTMAQKFSAERASDVRAGSVSETVSRADEISLYIHAARNPNMLK